MNSNKRDIYEVGRIYVGVTGKLVLHEISAIQSYPVQGSHSFKDGEDVTGRYELSWQIDDGIGWVIVDEDWYNRAKEDYRRIVSIPLPTHAPVAELPKEAEGKATAKFHGEINKPAFLVLLDYIDDMKQRGWDFEKHERTDLSNGNIRIDYILVRTAINQL